MAQSHATAHQQKEKSLYTSRQSVLQSLFWTTRLFMWLDSFIMCRRFMISSFRPAEADWSIPWCWPWRLASCLVMCITKPVLYFWSLLFEGLSAISCDSHPSSESFPTPGYNFLYELDIILASCHLCHMTQTYVTTANRTVQPMIVPLDRARPSSPSEQAKIPSLSLNSKFPSTT